MLYQDTLTGYLYEVPEDQIAAGQPVVYDGLGNPLGLPFLAPIAAAVAPLAAKALPAVASSLLPAAGRIFSRIFSRRPGVQPAAGSAQPPNIPALLQSLTSLVRRLSSQQSSLGEMPDGQLYQGNFEEYPETLAEYYPAVNPYGSWYQPSRGQWGYQPYHYQSGYQPYQYQARYQPYGYQGGYQPYRYQQWWPGR
ncbi:MAG: hypothetical protein HUU32_05965 [Calditrichaceae bacterium]|nr:hypothetical protein [Calditrichia bacterium]NUQ40923.1 hypothetical protein [Calditrichaceae bacterium]